MHKVFVPLGLHVNLPSIFNFGALAKLILIDLTLGVNNAVLIVPTCLSIPAAIRHRAMLFGTAGAIGLRAVMLALAGLLVGLPYIDLLAGAYLLYSGYRMLVVHATAVSNVKPHRSLYAAALAVAVADMVMSVDNVLVLAAAAHGLEGGLVYAIGAVCVSIPVILFGSGLLAKVIHRLPVLVWCGGALLGYVGVALALADPVISPKVSPDVAAPLSLTAAIGVIQVALRSRRLSRRRAAAA